MNYLSIAQTADQVGVCTKTVRRWIAAGDLSARRAGPRLLRVAQADLDAFMSAGVA